ncbi:SMEK domain-containing protein [Morganella morganii]|uniref:SMEK domain-containing protein n=1 Tax=Morganella morganii TaxID=582 RepID=UPI0034E3C64E
MMTRGIMIGQIIDQLEAVSLQAKTRNSLGLTDLSVFCENYIKDILNIVLDLKLENLNSLTSNFKGIDLGDEKKSIAFQITTTNTKAKIESTLSKITKEINTKYKEINIFIIGSKIKHKNVNKNNIEFSLNKNLLDIKWLQREIINLDVRKIKKIYDIINDTTAIILTELALPDSEGNLANIDNSHWQSKPEPQLPSGKYLIDYIEKEENKKLSIENKTNILNLLISLNNKLSSLPRQTREFIINFINNRNESLSEDNTSMAILITNELNFKYAGDIKSHEIILKQYDLLNIYDQDDEYGKIDYYYYSLELMNENRTKLKFELDLNLSLDQYLYDFLKEKNISLEDTFVNLDFSKI